MISPIEKIIVVIIFILMFLLGKQMWDIERYIQETEKDLKINLND